MPTYQNGTSAAITYNGETWAPAETKPVNFFVPDELGLTMTLDTPKVLSPTLASGSLAFVDDTEPSVRLYVPECGAFIGDFLVKLGAVKVQENYDDNPIEIVGDTTRMIRVAARRTQVEALWITPLAEAVVDYNISQAYALTK